MEGVDRLNELKDEMLVNNIMFRLDCTTKELIRTTATISKRWRNLWAQLPHLIFSDEDDITNFECDDTDMCDYISFVDNTLDQCRTNLNLKKFKLYINFSSLINFDFKSQANSWIRNAISRNVEDVDLRLLDMDVHQDFTYDDEMFFNNLCFNRLKVHNSEFKPPNGVISWERLEWLGLSGVTLDEDMIEKILSGSPCLESLELINCDGFRRIDVTSRSVKILMLSDYYCYWSDDSDCIKINAPYISSLTIKGAYAMDLVLLDVSSLIKAELDCRINPVMADDITHEERLRGLLESLQHVKDVIINDFWWEVYSQLKTSGVTFTGCSVMLKSLEAFGVVRIDY